MSELKNGQRLILADGTVLEDCQAGLADGFLWCWITNMSMAEAAQIFLDPAKTRTIVFEYGEMSDTFDGFTQCINMMVRQDETAVCLVKE